MKLQAESIRKLEAIHVKLHQLEDVKHAVREYHTALDRREHGGVAQDKCIKAIEAAIDIYWRK